MEQQTCTSCLKEKPMDDFYTDPNGRKYLRCKKCTSRDVLEKRIAAMPLDEQQKSRQRIEAKESRARLLEQGKIKCLKCGEVKDCSLFGRRKKADTYGFRCSDCQKAIDREARKAIVRYETPKQKETREWNEAQIERRKKGESKCTMCLNVYPLEQFSQHEGKTNSKCKMCEATIERAKKDHNAALCDDEHRRVIETIRATRGDAKTCTHCGESKDLSCFYYVRTTKTLKGKCIDCMNAYFMQREATDERKENRKRYRKTWTDKSADKQKAHSVVNRACKDGTLQRPSTCSRCGHQERIVAHHPDYSQPLLVIWLCEPCHKAEHFRNIN